MRLHEGWTLRPGDSRVRALSRSDVVLAGVLETVGGVDWRATQDPFEALARSVAGQQMSVKAASSVWMRLKTLLGEIRAERVLKTPADQLRAVGLSRRKAEYLHALAHRFTEGGLSDADFDTLANEEVIALLAESRGVGRWTAEMFLIFCLGREDVLALGDAGLQRAVSLAYAVDREDASRILPVIGEAWAPHRTIASLYLWRALDLGLLPVAA